MRSVNWPAYSSRLTLRRAYILVSPVPKLRVTPQTFIVGVATLSRGITASCFVNVASIGGLLYVKNSCLLQ